MVGMTGFEPAAPCSQSRCATKLRHIPARCILLYIMTKMANAAVALWSSNIVKGSYQNLKPSVNQAMIGL